MLLISMSFLRILRPHMLAKVALISKLKESRSLNVLEIVRLIVLSTDLLPKSTPNFPDKTSGAYV
jgi:hypothetical protein